MTPSDKEHWRYTFAGQAMSMFGGSKTETAKFAVELADALITELERTAEKECEHEFVICKKDNNLPATYINDGNIQTRINLITKCRKCNQEQEA